MKRIGFRGAAAVALAALLLAIDPAIAQLVDRTKAPNAAGEGIAKSLDRTRTAGLDRSCAGPGCH